MVAHDDLKLWCELVRDVVQQAEEAAYGRAVSVVFGDATLQGDFGGIVRLGRLVKYEESRYWPVLPGQVPVER